MATKKNEEIAEEKIAEEIIEEAKEQAAKIIAEAEKQAHLIGGNVGIIEPPIKKEQKTRRIYLFKDNDKYKDDVVVILNGRSYVIKRGVEVEVPEGVAQILDNSREQDAYTANLIEQKSSQYDAEAKAHNVY